MGIKEVKEDLKALKNPKNTKFADALAVATKHFGEYRVEGSPHIFKMPWPGNPFVNIQPMPRDKKMAKAYQVKELVKALKKLLAKLEEEQEKENAKKSGE